MSCTTNTGGPAFPTVWRNEGEFNAFAPDGQVVAPGESVALHGVTVRDYFAIRALSGLVVNGENFEPSRLASFCYELADAMLRARGQ